MFRLCTGGGVVAARGIRVRTGAGVVQARRVRMRGAGSVVHDVYQAVSVTIADRTVSRSATSGPLSSEYTVCSDGFVRGGSGGVALEQWCSDPLFIGNFEVRADHISGTVPSAGTLGVWLSCSANQGWSVSDSTQDETAVTSLIRVSIRDAASGIVQDTADVTLSANWRDSIGGGGGDL